MRKVAASVLAVLVLMGAAYLSAGAVAWSSTTAVDGSCMTLHANQTPASFTAVWGAQSPTVDASPYSFAADEVRIPSRTAGITLGAWWAPPADGRAGTVIVVHGRLSCRHDPVVLLPAGMLHRAGFGVLLVDLRNHGTSDADNGHWAGGADEWLDVAGAFDWLVAKGVPPASIGALGLSMGAGAATLALGNEPRIAAAWLDSGYADIVSMSMRVAEDGGKPAWLVPGALLMGQLVGGDPFFADSPERALAERRTGRPVAIVHGTADTTIPTEQGRRLAAAASKGGEPVTPWIIDGVRHVEAAFVATAEYERRLLAFFEGSLA